jgi:hypothetical protein
VNFPAALYTIQQWWGYASQSKEHTCMLGISNFTDRNATLPGATSLTPIAVLGVVAAFIPPEQIAQWTSDIDAGMLEQLDKNGVRSRPFYSQFNYGSVVNRLLLLASAHECEYLVRVDPGTLPPQDMSFAGLMAEHEAVIGDDSRTVVSRRYANRLALRDMFVREGCEAEHAEQVKKFTGIDVHAQVTGGAMLTLRTPGTPAVCFPMGSGLTLVWASDDGVYRVLPETKSKSKMLPEHPVERFDAVGKPKKSTEYYRGILGAVYLHAIREGMNADNAQRFADEFVGTLRDQILDADKCKKTDVCEDWTSTFCSENIAPRAFVDAIAVGQENHTRLLQEWEKICVLLKSSVVKETSANNRMDTDGE